MPGPLQWNNIAAPGTGAVDTFMRAGNMFGTAAKSISGLLQEEHNRRAKGAEDVLKANLLAAQTPEELEKVKTVYANLGAEGQQYLNPTAVAEGLKARSDALKQQALDDFSYKEKYGKAALTDKLLGKILAEEEATKLESFEEGKLSRKEKTTERQLREAANTDKSGNLPAIIQQNAEKAALQREQEKLKTGQDRLKLTEDEATLKTAEKLSPKQIEANKAEAELKLLESQNETERKRKVQEGITGSMTELANAEIKKLRQEATNSNIKLDADAVTYKKIIEDAREKVLKDNEYINVKKLIDAGEKDVQKLAKSLENLGYKNPMQSIENYRTEQNRLNVQQKSLEDTNLKVRETQVNKDLGAATDLANLMKDGPEKQKTQAMLVRIKAAALSDDLEIKKIITDNGGLPAIAKMLEATIRPGEGLDIFWFNPDTLNSPDKLDEFLKNLQDRAHNRTPPQGGIIINPPGSTPPSKPIEVDAGWMSMVPGAAY